MVIVNCIICNKTTTKTRLNDFGECALCSRSKKTIERNKKKMEELLSRRIPCARCGMLFTARPDRKERTCGKCGKK